MAHCSGDAAAAAADFAEVVSSEAEVDEEVEVVVTGGEATPIPSVPTEVLPEVERNPSVVAVFVQADDSAAQGAAPRGNITTNTTTITNEPRTPKLKFI